MTAHQDRQRAVIEVMEWHVLMQTLDRSSARCSCGYIFVAHTSRGDQASADGVRQHIADRVLQAADSIAPDVGTPRELEALRTLERYVQKRGDEAEALSRILWNARENIEMYADLIEGRHGKAAGVPLRDDIKEIDDYRASRGWSPNGYGGET